MNTKSNLCELLDDLVVPQKLCLKWQCLVMLLINVDKELVNGTTGTVRGFFHGSSLRQGVTLIGTIPAGGEKKWPLVDFETLTGTRRALVGAHEWTSN